jgi:Fic family protein
MPNPEQAVRNYLTYLTNPSSLRDDALITKLQTQIANTTDPIDKAKAISARQRAETVDGTTYRQDFITNAKPFAEANNITTEALTELGVPNEDLRAAGFTISRKNSPGSRAKRVTTDTIAAQLPSGAFTSRDLETATGASTGTVRRALSQLLAGKKITEAGVDPKYPGRGRAPMRYTTT